MTIPFHSSRFIGPDEDVPCVQSDLVCKSEIDSMYEEMRSAVDRAQWEGDGIHVYVPETLP